jgi:DNA-binding CsgD family transcriptional regulator/tetratricopeptide (TPR) repeat protein
MAGVEAGEGRMVLLCGEAGVGKTALVRRFTASLGNRPALVGACDPLETPRALGPLFDLAPGLDGGFADYLAGGPPAADLFATLLARLASAPAPLVLVFEDVHWADQATLDLLRFLGRRAERARALVVATYREEEVEPGGPTAVLLGDLATAPGVGRLSIAPLSREATARLSEGSGVDADVLHRLTGGNPFFITEVLAAGGAGLPTTVRDAVLARVARSSPASRAALEAAAAVGPRIDPELLASLLDAEGAPRWGVREAVLAGLLVWRGPNLAFRHELAQAAISEATAPEHRARLHGQLLGLLRREPPGPDGPAVLVRHAEAAGDDAAVVELAPAAAARSAALSAHREAAALYGKALAKGRDLPPADRAELVERRAQERYLSGQLRDAASDHREAAALRLRLGQHLEEGRNLSRLSALSFIAGAYDEADATGEAAITSLERLPPGPELAMAYESRARLKFMTFETEEALPWAERALDLARRLEVPETAVEAGVMAAAARLAAGDERAAAELEAARTEAERRGLPDQQARAMLYLAWLPIVQHRYAGVERYLEEGLAHAREHELGFWWMLVAGARVQWALDQGRWWEVEPLAHEVLGRPEAVSLARLPVLVALGRLQARRGDAGGLGWLDEALALVGTHHRLEAVVPVWPARAEAFWLMGDPSRVLEEVRAGLEQGTGARSPWWVGELAFWRSRASPAKPPELPGPVAEPYALALGGDWRGAASWWEGRGCPYETALSLSLADEVEPVRRAVGILDGLGARPAADEARRRLRELGVASVPRGPRASTSANPAGLTRREGEVLELVAAGLTNAEIGMRLFLTEKTVEHHLSAILRKLDATTRAEAVERARLLGVLPGKVGEGGGQVGSPPPKAGGGTRT